jgi:hypothetical protein
VVFVIEGGHKWLPWPSRKDFTARIQDMLFGHESGLHCWLRSISLVRSNGEKQAAIQRDDSLKKLIIEYTTCESFLI